jgi:hypothetical protein
MFISYVLTHLFVGVGRRQDRHVRLCVLFIIVYLLKHFRGSVLIRSSPYEFPLVTGILQ